MNARRLVEVAETLARLKCARHDLHLPLDAMRLSTRNGEVHCELNRVEGVCCEEFFDLARREAGLEDDEPETLV